MVCRVGARILSPLKSAIVLIWRSRVWMNPLSCTLTDSIWMPGNSLRAYLSKYSQAAWLVASADADMNGSSNTSISGKRPAV